MIAMVVLAFSVVSVAVWLSAQVWFHMLMGIGVSMGYGVYASLRPASPGQYLVPVSRAPPAGRRALR
jgi:hypothetical protein